MEETKNEDCMIAQRLQRLFDDEVQQISSEEEDVLIIDSVERDHQFALRLQARYEAEAVTLLSDSDDDIILNAQEASGDCGNKLQQIISTGKCEKGYSSVQQPKVFKKEASDLNSKEFFIDELQAYVDPELNFEWKFVDVLPNIQAIFNKFDELFFQSRCKQKKMNIIWSTSMGNTCTNRNFNDENGRYTISLNKPLLTLRPRIEIISIILHELIHALLKIEGIKESNFGHGNNFRKIMTFLNSMLQTNISFNHKLNNMNPACRYQWYRCTGICHNYDPFYGVVRSIDGPPGLHNEWWKEHTDDCGGTFYKIFEMSRIVAGEISTRYAVSVNYMLPKRENIRGRFKTRLPATESIDLTSDVPKVIPTDSLDTITIDTEDTAETPTSLAVADNFIDHFCRSVAFTRDTYEMQCPICQGRIKRKLFANHIDGCRGFVRHVPWKASANGRIVQNGLLELKTPFSVQSSVNPTVKRLPDSNSHTPSSSSFANYQQIKRKRFG